MNWTYLIQFADKNVPEKQEIELTIFASPLRSIVEDEDIPFIFPSNGEFRILIQHTARSWAYDIEGLLTNQINSILLKEESFFKLIRRKSSQIGIITALLFFLGSIIGIYINTKSFLKSELIKVDNFVSANNQNVSKKVDFILNYIASNDQNFFFIKSLIFIVVSVVIAIVLGIWVENLANNRRYSFVVLTRESVRAKDAYEVKKKRKTLWFFLSLIISIVSGIASNYLFNWLTS